MNVHDNILGLLLYTVTLIILGVACHTIETKDQGYFRFLRLAFWAALPHLRPGDLYITWSDSSFIK